MDGNLARTYTLVHAFLVKHAHVRAAQALKKSVKQLILKDDAIPEGPSLDDIVRSWKPRSQDEDQEGDSDSSSSSSSSSSNSKKTKLKNKGNKSSSSSSSESSSESESEKKAKKKSSNDDGSSDSKTWLSDSKLETTILKLQRTSSSTLSSNDLYSPVSESEISEKKNEKSTITSKEKRSKATASSIGHKVEAANKLNGKHNQASSSSEDSSDPDSSEDSGARSKAIHKSSKAKSSSSSSSSSGSSEDSDSERQNRLTSKEGKSFATPSAQVTETPVNKKRRTDVEGNSVASAVSAEEKEFRRKNDKVGKNPRTTNNRFSRVNPTRIQSAVDNSYVAKNAPTNDYGKRAHQDLVVTRGAGFRKEKNKKKRGSYRGGEITMESHSFKFAYD